MAVSGALFKIKIRKGYCQDKNQKLFTLEPQSSLNPNFLTRLVFLLNHSWQYPAAFSPKAALYLDPSF